MWSTSKTDVGLKGGLCVSAPAAESQECSSTFCIVSSWLFFPHHIIPISPSDTGLQLFPLPYFVYAFPSRSPASAHKHCAMLESIVPVHLFLWLLLSSETNSKVNQFSSTSSPIAKSLYCPRGAQTVFREPLCGQKCFVTSRIALLTCRTHLLVSKRIKNCIHSVKKYTSQLLQHTPVSIYPYKNINVHIKMAAQQ